MRLQTLGLTLFLVVQAWSVSAQGPSVEKQASGVATKLESENRREAIRFEKNVFPDAREGYASLQWNDVLPQNSAQATYLVRDQSDEIIYRGTLPMAFVSGLADGEYQFRVEAVDAEGYVLARSHDPAVVKVRHWPVWQAMISFAIGAVVFVALIAVIVHGSWMTRRLRPSDRGKTDAPEGIR